MARKITMFELHFDGARFGPSFGSKGEKETESADVESEYEESYEAEEESSGSRMRPILALVGLVLLVAAARQVAKRRGKTEDEYGIEIDEEAETVHAE